MLYYNDLATILFHPQETAIKQLFHQNGEGGGRGGRGGMSGRVREGGRGLVGE